jgi:pimeloyl-ACP methyl ester carboxylesterase
LLLWGIAKQLIFSSTKPGTEAGVGSAFARRFNLLDTTVFTPTLTGLGERSHLNSAAVALSTHIADIVNLIKWEELSDVVLCGHFYAGCVITGVADQIPDRIRALVFLDAFVLENGESFMDIVPSELALSG